MASEEVVRLEDVWVEMDHTPILEAVNLSVDQHDFIGIIGPNGGGKTTMFKVMLGLVRPSRGRVTVLGTTPEKGRRRVGYVPQDSLFDRDFPASVWDVVLMGRLGRVGRLRRFSAEDKAAAWNALETVEMQRFKDRQIGRLSGGQQQRVFIARALVSDPRLLLLDEPTASVDAPMMEEFYELLNRLKQRMAIVLVTHDLSAVSVYVDTVGCLSRKLFYHHSKEISREDLEAAYQCPIELIAHGVPHRVLREHT
ncbi:MAG: ABC transporter ATP-binding protein [Chloroflexota bacterium]|nr:ABC transporter ATP-binding protein [Chloroflexota bacterium]